MRSALLLSLVQGGVARAQEVGYLPTLRAQSYQMLRDRTPRVTTTAIPDKCGLHVIAAAFRDRRILSAAQRSALSILQGRPSLQTSIVSAGFRVHFDTTGINTPALLDSAYQRIPGTALAYAESVASIASNVYTYVTAVLGFMPPPSDGGLGGGPEFDIYVEDLGPDLYGQTTPDNDVIDGGTSSSFIEIHNDFTFVNPARNRGLPAMRVTLAHEFTHAVTIGSYGFWFSDTWFHEISATWMEDMVYHGINDYLNYLFAPQSQFQTPDVPLPTNDFIYYSRAIWGKYLTKKFGRDAMLHIWQTARQMAPVPATDKTLHDQYNSSLPVAFAEWALWNYFTGPRADTVRYYDEARLFPLEAETYYQLNVPLQLVSGTLGCLSSAYFGFLSGADTVTVALANINGNCPPDATTQTPFTLTVSKTKIDNTYRAIAGGLFLKLDVGDASQWFTWDIERNGVGVPAIADGSPFPDPFRPDGQNALYIPAGASEANVTIYSSSMDLVYSAYQQPVSRLGQSVFVWNGRTTGGNAVNSGVYFYVLEMGNRIIRGKFALVR